MKYLELDDLLSTCEVISFHLPKHTELLQKEQFDLLPDSGILVNTSLGLPFEIEAFQSWIENKNHYAIFDGDGKKELPEALEERENVIALEKSAGWSAQTLVRLSEKVLQNIADFCENN